jgi:hypothetical protein
MTETSNEADGNGGVTISRRTIYVVGVVVIVIAVGVVGFVIGRVTKPAQPPAHIAAPVRPTGTSSTSPIPATTTIPTTTTAPANRAILPPATTAPAVAECSQQLNYGADGSYGPLTCANGTEVNALAWNAAAADRPLVMSLGPNATPGQVNAALCTDIKNSTIPIETGAYQLAALYYGWSFAYDPTSELTNGSCG